MAQLSDNQLDTVRALLTSAPDGAVSDLETALASGSERHTTMRMIHGMVAAEATDRRARNAVFRPLAPLCGAPRAGLRSPIFPLSALRGVWRGLKLADGREVRQAMAGADPRCVEPPPEELYDQLCAQAAEGLRARANPGYAAAAAALDQAASGGAEQFAAYLDLAPVARRSLERMHDWLGRLNDERIAAARLAFRDATAIAEDAGPRLMEILYAHLEEPWAVLRLISAVMQRPTDRFVASTELAVFGDRLLDDIDAHLKVVGAFNAEHGRSAGLSAGAAVRAASMEIQEFDESIDLAPDGPWTVRLSRQRKALVLAVEGRLKAVEAEVAAALPLQSAAFRRQGVRGQPKLIADPDTRQVQRGLGFLSFLAEVRGAGDRMGFGALWNKTTEQVQARLDTYVEDLLDKLRTREGDNLERVRAYLDVSAEFMGLLSDDRAAQIVRRRMAAAA